ncbi:MAG: chemotaxis response regulator protein-glutamate methylesterase [Alphaproteobacteria bacterium]|nr:chemotaxis response regulator protein-glutamate methylesterase [Alphaproteobacteria bacterium]
MIDEAPGRPTRVVVVDDSALIRQLLAELIGAEPDMEVVGVASDPIVARHMIKTFSPDVITLDIEMPRMDGLDFLERLMRLRPMPVVMVSSLTESGAEATLRALELGAVDFVAKPKLDLRVGMEGLRDELVRKVRAASRAKVRAPSDRSAPAIAPSLGYRSTETIVAIGASTGGVEALRDVICALPADAPATLVVQHMPEKFTATFAARLDGMAAVHVSEASDGARVLPGHVYIAPGSYHLSLARSGANYVCEVRDGAPVSGHRPSVDVLFNSVARVAGQRSIGVILTGMGRDGADGLLAMRNAGAATLGEDASSCVVYGMPKAASQAGAVERELPLSKMGAEILRLAATKGRAIRI